MKVRRSSIVVAKMSHALVNSEPIVGFFSWTFNTMSLALAYSFSNLLFPERSTVSSCLKLTNCGFSTFDLDWLQGLVFQRVLSIGLLEVASSHY